MILRILNFLVTGIFVAGLALAGVAVMAPEHLSGLRDLLAPPTDHRRTPSSDNRKSASLRSSLPPSVLRPSPKPFPIPVPIPAPPPKVHIPPVDYATPLNKRLAAKALKRGMPVFLRIIKESGELEVWMKRRAQWVRFVTYPICKWSGTLGPKLREGDGQSPEGFYTVNKRALNPNSSYHLSFNIAFPNSYDRAHGRTGSFLMVHGDCQSVGCYAMTNRGIEDIYGLVKKALFAGQRSVPVHIFPFRMSDENIKRHKSSPWASYWKNLKPGWDYFEKNHEPPVVKACGKHYRFGVNTSEASCRDIVGL